MSHLKICRSRWSRDDRCGAPVGPVRFRLKMTLHPLQRLLQPIEIEITVEVQIFHCEQSEEPGDPPPANHPFFASFGDAHRRDDVRRRGQRQAPQSQPVRFGCRRELQVSEASARDGRDADENNDQEEAVDELDRQSQHKQSGAGVPLAL